MAPSPTSFGRRAGPQPALKLVSAPRVAACGAGLVLLLIGPSWTIRALTGEAPTEAAAVSMRVGDTTLRVAPSWMAAPSTRETLRLGLSWPGLQAARFASSGSDDALVVELRSGAGEDAAERASQRHARFVTAETEAEHGLVRRGFAPGSPYARDLLVQGVADGDAFEALCPGAATRDASTPASGPPERCVARWRQSGLEVTLRFPPSALPAWRELRSRVGDLIERASMPAP